MLISKIVVHKAYDGASAMVKAKEASAVTKGQQPMADSIHCRNHYINLAIAFAVKNKTVSKLMDDLKSSWTWTK